MRIESVIDLHSQFPDPSGLWNPNDLAATETALRQTIPSDPECEWNRTALNSITQLVRILNLQAKFDEARQTLDLARKVIPNSDPQIRAHYEIRLLLEEGRHLCLAMTPAKAQRYFQQAWSMASDSGEEFLAIEAAVMMSVSQPAKSQNEWLQKAMTLASESKDEQSKLWLAQLYLMEGWHAFDFRRYEDALKSFELALARPRVSGERTDVALIQWCVARCLRALGRTEEALTIQRTLLNSATLTGRAMGYVYLEVAECLQLLKKIEDARIYFESAYKELSSDGWYSDNRASELSRMQYLYKKR